MPYDYARIAADPKLVDPSLADSEAAKSTARSAMLEKTMKDLQDLSVKIEGGDRSAKKRFAQAYSKLRTLGDVAVKAAQKLLHTYANFAKEVSKKEEERQREAVLRLLDSGIDDWDRSESLFEDTGHDGDTRTMLREAKAIYGYAQALEARVRGVSRTLKGDFKSEEAQPGYGRTAAHSIQGNAYGKPLYGHTDENSAYLVEDYPYGARARCRIRYWMESSPSKGFRFVAQTEDPKRLRWNSPKKSTYTEWGGAMYLDSQGHVQWVGVGQYTNDAKMLDFVKSFPDSDMSILKKVVPAKIKYLLMRISGKSGFTMNGIPVEMSEGDIEESSKDLETWKEIAKYVR